MITHKSRSNSFRRGELGELAQGAAKRFLIVYHNLEEVRLSRTEIIGNCLGYGLVLELIKFRKWSLYRR